MARYLGNASKIKFFVVTPDNVRYTYDLPPSDTWMTLPLTGGDGIYTLDVREHVEADLYSNLYKETIDVALNDEFRPFLYPNQYTWFTEDSAAVAKASELADGAADGLEVIASIYNYVIENVTYDDEKARTVQSGYLPDVDETLASGTGICFDYAALMTAMLRSQSIPTKLEIGYSGEVYHAWISTYIEEIGWVDNVIQFDGKNWSLVDPTLAASNDADDVRKYIGDGTNLYCKIFPVDGRDFEKRKEQIWPNIRNSKSCPMRKLPLSADRWPWCCRRAFPLWRGSLSCVMKRIPWRTQVS